MIDEIFHYHTRHNLISALDLSTEAFQGEAKCRVKVSGNAVIGTELKDNPGQSITNAASELAMQVAAFYEIPLDKLIWIEHYSSSESYEDDPREKDWETFDQVSFTRNNGRLSVPRWRRITKEEALSLLSDH
ncbi:MAG: hypothetical protein F6J86_06615 [Symploca sp. SIO1B1]|nr:hypothetical protein [Symploca sp. SIO1B1]